MTIAWGQLPRCLWMKIWATATAKAVAVLSSLVASSPFAICLCLSIVVLVFAKARAIDRDVGPFGRLVNLAANFHGLIRAIELL